MRPTLVRLIGTAFLSSAVFLGGCGKDGSETEEITVNEDERAVLESMRPQADALIASTLGRNRAALLTAGSEQVSLSPEEMDALKTSLIGLLRDRFGESHTRFYREGSMVSEGGAEADRLTGEEARSAARAVQTSVVTQVTPTRYLVASLDHPLWGMTYYYMDIDVRYLVLPWVTWNWATTKTWVTDSSPNTWDGSFSADLAAVISDSQGTVVARNSSVDSVQASGNGLYGFFPSIPTCTSQHGIAKVFHAWNPTTSDFDIAVPVDYTAVRAWRR